MAKPPRERGAKPGYARVSDEKTAPERKKHRKTPRKAASSAHPNPEMAKQVETFAGIGCSYDAIATLTGVSFKTIQKHYGAIVLLGREKANANVASAMYQSAVGDKEHRPDVNAGKFWLAQRAGWRTPEQLRKALENTIDKETLRRASDADIEDLVKILQKIGGPAAVDSDDQGGEVDED